jgi:hypothetical protein
MNDPAITKQRFSIQREYYVQTSRFLPHTDLPIDVDTREMKYSPMKILTLRRHANWTFFSADTTPYFNHMLGRSTFSLW